MPEIRAVDVHDDQALTDWYEALRQGATAGRAAPLLSAYAAMASSFRDPGPARRRIPVAALDGGSTVGALLVELPLAENLTTAEVEIDVPPSQRRRGIGGALWRWAAQRLEAEGRTVAQVEIHVPAGDSPATWPGARFATRLGFTSVHVEDHLVLPLPADAPALPTPAGYELITWAGICPDEHLGDLATMSTAMSADVPAGEMTHETARWDEDRVRVNEQRLARHHLSLVCLARAAGGEPAGYSQIFVAHDDPANALQDDTFVAREHRGRRLSALLKAANLEQLERHRAGRRFLHTWTSAENPAMRKVNAGFGFRIVEQTHVYERG